MDPMAGFDIRLVFTFPPKDSTLQDKNAYTSEITFLALVSCFIRSLNNSIIRLFEQFHAFSDFFFKNLNNQKNLFPCFQVIARNPKALELNSQVYV